MTHLGGRRQGLEEGRDLSFDEFGFCRTGVWHFPWKSSIWRGCTLVTSTCVLPSLLHREAVADRSFRGAGLQILSLVCIDCIFPPDFLPVRV